MRFQNRFFLLLVLLTQTILSADYLSECGRLFERNQKFESDKLNVADPGLRTQILLEEGKYHEAMKELSNIDSEGLKLTLQTFAGHLYRILPKSKIFKRFQTARKMLLYAKEPNPSHLLHSMFLSLEFYFQEYELDLCEKLLLQAQSLINKSVRPFNPVNLKYLYFSTRLKILRGHSTDNTPFYLEQNFHRYLKKDSPYFESAYILDLQARIEKRAGHYNPAARLYEAILNEYTHSRLPVMRRIYLMKDLVQTHLGTRDYPLAEWESRKMLRECERIEGPGRALTLHLRTVMATVFSKSSTLRQARGLLERTRAHWMKEYKGHETELLLLEADLLRIYAESGMIFQLKQLLEPTRQKATRLFTIYHPIHSHIQKIALRLERFYLGVSENP